MNLEQPLLLISGTDADLAGAIFTIKNNPEILDASDDAELEYLYTTLTERLKKVTIVDSEDKQLTLKRDGIFVLVMITNQYSARNPYNPEIAEALHKIAPGNTTTQ